MRRNSRAPAAPSLNLVRYGLVAALLAVSVGTLLRAPLLIQLPCLAFLVWVIAKRALSLLPAAALLVFLYVGTQFFPNAIWRVPSAGFLLPLFLAALVSYPFAEARRAWRWLRAGHADLATSLLALVTALLSAGVLALWAFSTDRLGAGAAILRDYEGLPLWFLYLVGVPGFALVNAAAEEGIFRGVFLSALREQFPNRRNFAILLQALAFAVAHYWAGFPNGPVGLCLTFVYGAMLGHLRLRSRGMLVPYLTHVFADLVIGFLLIALARGA